ncbi:MAG: hypothetical protein J0M12_08740 [Deltaproteobacteria bacterium]|nr:hypothetical protein [Deltaproteobacteria bacterium]
MSKVGSAVVACILFFSTSVFAQDLPLDPRPPKDSPGLLPIICGDFLSFRKECNDPCFVLFQACADQVERERLDCNYDCLLKYENDPAGLRQCALGCIDEQNKRTKNECGDLRNSCYQIFAEDGESQSMTLGMRGMLSSN